MKLLMTHTVSCTSFQLYEEYLTNLKNKIKYSSSNTTTTSDGTAPTEDTAMEEQTTNKKDADTPTSKESNNVHEEKAEQEYLEKCTKELGKQLSGTGEEDCLFLFQFAQVNILIHHCDMV